MRMTNFGNTCTARVLDDVGEILYDIGHTSEEAFTRGDYDFEAATALVDELLVDPTRKGRAFVTAVLTKCQKQERRIIETCGFKKITPWVRKPRHEETRTAVFIKILHPELQPRYKSVKEG